MTGKKKTKKCSGPFTPIVKSVLRKARRLPNKRLTLAMIRGSLSKLEENYTGEWRWESQEGKKLVLSKGRTN